MPGLQQQAQGQTSASGCMKSICPVHRSTLGFKRASTIRLDACVCGRAVCVFDMPQTGVPCHCWASLKPTTHVGSTYACI